MDSLQDNETWDDLRIPDLGDAPVEALADDGANHPAPASGAEPEARPERRRRASDTPGDAGAAERRAPPPKLCVAFRGIGGGVGTTTVAIETAHVLASSRRGKVCLVDLDFELGTLSHYLDATTQPVLDDLRGDAGRLDAQYLRARLFNHEAGFAVFAAKGTLGGNEKVDPACVLEVLDTLSDMFDVLVLDVPRLSRPWTQAALMASDCVCLVSELTIPALHICRQRVEEVKSLGAERVEVVLSKYERRSFRAALRVGDAERALGQNLAGAIAADPNTAHDALNCAVPVGRASRDSRLVKDVGALARAISPHYAERRKRPR